MLAGEAVSRKASREGSDDTGMDADLAWQEWKRWLSQAVSAGREAGLGSRELVDYAERVGDFLARHVDPANPQQRVLKELWSVADQGEQRAIASALVKLVGQAGDVGGGYERDRGRGFTLS